MRRRDGEVHQRLVNWLPLTGGRPCLYGDGSSVTLPPAAVMAASAACETAWAVSYTAMVISPRASTFTSVPLRTRPAATKTSGVTTASFRLVS